MITAAEQSINVFKDNVNLVIGAAAGLLAYVFGDFWIFFMAFFAANITDYITGIIKARLTKTENSNKGALGIAKKSGYWVIVGISFFISATCIKLGESIGIDLTFLSLTGYFTLAVYIINELRSIVENLVVIGVYVPKFLIDGLYITQKLMEDKQKIHDSLTKENEIEEESEDEIENYNKRND